MVMFKCEGYCVLGMKNFTDDKREPCTAARALPSAFPPPVPSPRHHCLGLASQGISPVPAHGYCCPDFSLRVDGTARAPAPTSNREPFVKKVALTTTSENWPANGGALDPLVCKTALSWRPSRAREPPRKCTVLPTGDMSFSGINIAECMGAANG